MKSVILQEEPAVIVGGNDENGTMYAVYELLERTGIVFQLNKNIIPEQKPDLSLPMLNVRMDRIVKYRGVFVWHGYTWYMGLDDYRKLIDQLAKLKFNCLQFYSGMCAPWVECSYKGKVAELITTPESGYLATTGTIKDVSIGQKCFSHERLCAPEFVAVQSAEGPGLADNG